MFREEMRQRGFVFLAGTPGVMPAPHCHREVEVNLVVCGEMGYLFGGRRITLPAGQIAVFWATIPHGVVHVAEGTRYYCIHLPLVRFLRWSLPGAITSRLLHGEIVQEPESGRFERDFAQFCEWERDLTNHSPEANHVVLLELEARFRRLAWSLTRGLTRGITRGITHSNGEDAAATGVSPTAPHGPPLLRNPLPDPVEQMAVFMTENYQERLAMSEIARQVHLHPKYAATLFRKYCGMTPNEYLTQHRLSQAQRLLVTTDQGIVDIAFASGFGSVSQFYEVFKQYCDQSPRDFRALQR